MTRVRNWWLMAAFLPLLPCVPARAQTSTTEFLPEIDAHLKLHSNVRFVFQAKDTREDGDPTQVELGPSIDFYLKPLVKLRDTSAFDPDDSKLRLLVLSIGYRNIPSPNKAPENRIEPVTTFHFPLKTGIPISDRNRADLDWSNGKFTWRYRNRLTFERAVKIRSYHPKPYVSAEGFCDSQYGKWSTTALYAGCLFPLGKHVQFDPYYEHEDNTGKKPYQQVNAAGLVLNLRFWAGDGELCPNNQLVRWWEACIGYRPLDSARHAPSATTTVTASPFTQGYGLGGAGVGGRADL